MESKIFLKDFFELLSPHYRIYQLLKDGLYEFKTYSQDYELFILGNYIAISKSIVLK